MCSSIFLLVINRKSLRLNFLILTEKQPHFELVTQIRDKLYEIELEMDTILSAIIRSRKEWESGIMAGLPFKQEVEKDGVRI